MQNVVILEAELTFQERAWYIRVSRQYGWSKLELVKKIQERVHEAISLDTKVDLCYSNGNGDGEDGTKETPEAFGQDLWDAEVQRKLRRQGTCGSHLQSLLLAQQVEQMTLHRLESLPLHHRTKREMIWLKNRTHDYRPEIKTLAYMVYAERFLRLVRNQKKQKRSIQTLALSHT